MSDSRESPVVVITGASAGVGRATARAFAARRARIGLLARGRAGLEGARQDVEGHGGEALVVPTDTSDAEQVELAAQAVERRFGPIDIWINNAMCSVFSPVMQMTPADYRRVMEVTFLGYVHGTLAALRRMHPRDRGTIIQVGSALAYRGIPLQSAYCAAKHAVQGFNDSLRAELIHDNSQVRVSGVHLPAMNTPQFNWVKTRLPRKPQPVPPIFQPEIAAEAIVYATQHYRREWYVGMPTVVAIEGDKLLPGVGDWFLGQQGYEAQQYDGPIDPERQHNLYQPVDADVDFGAHGDFDSRSQDYSRQVLLDRQRGLIALASLAGAVGDVLQNGPSKFWRGALVGLAAGALGALSFSARPTSRMGRTEQQSVPRNQNRARQRSGSSR